MKFITRQSREQTTLLLASIDDYIDENNSTRVIDAYVETLDMKALDF